MNAFRNALRSGARLFFDGALGTMLQARGMPAGESPEAFGAARPDILASIHLEYIRAGANVITTNTFGGTPCKLSRNLEAVSCNRHMAAIARQAVQDSGKQAFVAGSLGPTGKFLRPLGDMDFRDMVHAYRKQISGLAAGGVDLLLAETHFDLAEARAAVVAARLECPLPIGVSMTFEDGVSLTGATPEVFAATMANMGVDFIGVNCGAGPAQMAEVAERLVAASSLPVLAQPNAGLPELAAGGTTLYRLPPEPFADGLAAFAQKGVQLLGGCCGTTPAHITAACAKMAYMPPTAPRPDSAGVITLTSRSSLVRIGAGEPLCVIGERINPTGKKQLSAELAAGEYGTALRFADEQVSEGAHVLDVNVGAPSVDEKMVLPLLVNQLCPRHAIPLSLDSSNPAAIAAGLEAYPACPLVNSISGEAGHMETLGGLCRDFGAPFVLLPLQGKTLPETASARIKIIETLLQKMDDLSIPRSLAMADILVLTVAANAHAANECLAVIRYCTEQLRLPTVAGLSNISFGLPARELVNSAFLAMAVGAGLAASIANPGASRIREIVAASNLLQCKDPSAERFTTRYASWTPGGQGSAAPKNPGDSGNGAALSLETAVILGRKDEIIPVVDAELAAGAAPFALVGERLIPAITEVGAKYERREYFLPQLVRSAETVQTAFSRLRPLLEQDPSADNRPVVIMATVEGDIHDIGKNIVNLMLANHNFDVVDLGKDVPARDIVAAARAHKASIIGLSALMTTTMVRMNDTVALLKREGLDIPVLVGGAVLTEAFAASIGATYAADAVSAVRMAQKLACCL